MSKLHLGICVTWGSFKRSNAWFYSIPTKSDVWWWEPGILLFQIALDDFSVHQHWGTIGLSFANKILP